MDSVRTGEEQGSIDRFPCHAALFFLVLTTVSCSKSVDTLPQQPSRSPITLTIGVPHPTPEDPLRGLLGAARLVSFEGLSTIGRDGHARPRLAESWQESADGLSWSIKLRQNGFFHDGSPVDANSVKLSLEQSLAGNDRVMSPGLDDIVSLETPASHTLVVKVRNRSTFLMDDLSVAISKREPSKPPVGTGPYVTDSTSADEVMMRAFPKYYRGIPTIDRIRWKVYPTVRTAWAAMMRGEIDFLYEVGQDIQEFIQGESSVAVFPFLRNYVYAVALNSKREVFKDWRVRRALNHSVDRDAIVAQGFKGHATPASGTTWPQHWAYDSTVPGYSYEPARAAALLDAAGVPAATRAGPDRAPARLRFTCIFPEGFPLWERIGLLVQRNFSAIGVDMRLETVSVKDFSSRIAAGEFDAVLSEFVVGNSPSRPFTFWYSGSKQNAWGYQSQKVDEALDGIRRAANDADYRDAFRRFQLEILDNPPAVFLALGETSRAVSKRFRVVAPSGSDILPTIGDWQIASSSIRATN